MIVYTCRNLLYRHVSLTSTRRIRNLLLKQLTSYFISNKVELVDVLIIIVIIIIISFMQGIYTYIPETNYVPREYSVAAILLLLFMVLISSVSVLNLLQFYISTFRSMCAVPNMAVVWISLNSCFHGMLLTYFLNNFETVPVAPASTGITFDFTFHMRCISIVRSLYFRIFSVSFLITFLLLLLLLQATRGNGNGNVLPIKSHEGQVGE